MRYFSTYSGWYATACSVNGFHILSSFLLSHAEGCTLIRCFEMRPGDHPMTCSAAAEEALGPLRHPKHGGLDQTTLTKHLPAGLSARGAPSCGWTSFSICLKADRRPYAASASAIVWKLEQCVRVQVQEGNGGTDAGTDQEGAAGGHAQGQGCGLGG
jgi:hypothetical protein